MNDKQDRLIRAAESGIIFFVNLENPPLRVAEAAKRLQETLREARAAILKQFSAMKLRGAPHISLKLAKEILLRQHLGPIVADGLEVFAGFPGVKETLRPPRIKDKPEKFLEAAERVARFAETHKQEFIENRNYSPDFLEQLELAVRDLESAASADPGTGRARYSQATHEVKEAITRVRRALRALDSRVHEAYFGDRATLDLWRRASRRPAKLGRPKKRKPRVKRTDRLEGTA